MFVLRRTRPTITGAMILSTLLTGKYYTPHLSPLMSHKFWTIKILTLLQHGSSDRQRTQKFSFYGLNRAIMFCKIKIARMVLYLYWKKEMEAVEC